MVADRGQEAYDAWASLVWLQGCYIPKLVEIDAIRKSPVTITEKKDFPCS